VQTAGDGSDVDSGIEESKLALPSASPINVDVRSLVRLAFAPALALAGIAVALATQVAVTHDSDIPQPGWGFLLAALLFAAAAFVISRQGVTDADAAAAFVLPRYWEFGLVAAVIGLAIFFRFFRFMEFPPGLWYDEAVNGTDALSIIDRDHFTVWRESNFGHSTIFFYLLIVSYKLFGYTVFAMRLVPAVMGVAAVIAFYFLARWLLGPVPAVVATALLAVSRFAVTFSRISWEASLQPLFEIFAVYFFVRALETRSRLYFFLGGGALAAGIYTYLGFRFVPFVLLFFLVYIAVSQRQLLMRNVAGIAIYAVSFVVVVTPLAQYAIQNQDQFLARTRDISVFKEIDKADSYAPLRHNIRTSFEMMNVRGDSNGRHNLPDAPMLDDVSAALLVLGLAVCAWSIRNWRKGAMAGWLVLALVPGALTISIENPSAIRAVGAIPPLYLIPGLAVAFVYRTLSPTAAGRTLFAVCALSLVGGSAALNYHDFFDNQYHSKAVYDSFGPIPTQVAQLAARESAHKNVYVSREFNGHPAFVVLSRGKKIDIYNPAANIALPRSDKDYLLIVDPRQLGMLPTLRRLYPNLDVQDDVDEWGRLQFTKVVIPAADVDALHRVEQTIAITPTGAIAAGPAQTSQDFASHAWTDADLAGGSATVTWDGHLWVSSAPGNVAFRLTSPGAVSLEVDGKQIGTVPEGELDVPQAPLAFGEHTVRVVAAATHSGDTSLKISIDGRVTDAADTLYSTSLSDRGFQAVYRPGRDFSAPATLVTHIPFAISALALSGTQSVDYRGLFDAPTDGEFGFALDTGVAAQLLVDDQLVVDSGGTHAPRRTEGTAALTAGQHLLSIQFTGTDRAEWALFLKPPGSDWTQADGSEFTPPTGEFKPPAVVTLAQDAAWSPTGRKIDGIDAPAAVAVLPDGTAIVGAEDKLAFVKPDGTSRLVKIDGASDISDLDVTPAGLIAVVDHVNRSLYLVDTDGKIQQRFEGAFTSASGVGVQGNLAYVASPAGGVIYKVPLDGSAIVTLPISNADASVKAVQPSDIAVAPDGALFMSDFDRKKIVISADGATGRTFSGVAGTGTQIPHVALYHGLLLVSDPLSQRIVMYDRAGKQRGVYVFPGTGLTGARPVGIAVTADGLVYAADPELGLVYRLKISIPPEAQDLVQ
jgi:4-amino-4-deoxy-L-arabinose transferase-like glycosyltransferase